MSTSVTVSRLSQRGAPALTGPARELDQEMMQSLKVQLQHLLHQLRRTPGDTTDVRSFLQVNTIDLKSIVADAPFLVRTAAYTRHPDIVLALLDARAKHDFRIDLYSILLAHDTLFDLNGDVLDDAGIAARLRDMYEKHGLRRVTVDSEVAGHMASLIDWCVLRDRLECLRVMIEVDSQSRGYTSWCHESLLHLAARYCKPRIMEHLMQSGWGLETHDLNRDRLSPLGSCMFAAGCFESAESSDCADAAGICTANLSILLQHTADAVRVVRASGLCDMPVVGSTPDIEADRGCAMPSPAVARIHVYVCAAVNAVSVLPRRVLGSSDAKSLRISSPAIFRAIHLDEHVTTTVDRQVYLPDPLRLREAVDPPTLQQRHGVPLDRIMMTELPSRSTSSASFRFAAAVDALCVVEDLARSDRGRWSRAHLLYESNSDVPIVTGISPTLRHWAWMRRRHALHARRRRLAK